MGSTKFKTVFVNGTGQVLILRVGNPNCFAKLATLGVGEEHKVELDVNWTYQEFSLETVQPAGLVKSNVVVSSDDCLDFERITVITCGGKLHASKVPRGQLNFSTRVPVITTRRPYFTWPRLVNWRFWL